MSSLNAEVYIYSECNNTLIVLISYEYTDCRTLKPESLERYHCKWNS